MTEHEIVDKLKELFPAPHFKDWRMVKAATVDVFFGECRVVITNTKVSVDPMRNFCHSPQELLDAISALPAPVAPARLSDAEVQEIEDCYPKDAPAPAAETEDDELANIVNRAWAKDVKELETRLAHYEELLPIAEQMRSRLKHEPHGPFYSDENCDCGLNSLLADFAAWQAKNKETSDAT